MLLSIPAYKTIGHYVFCPTTSLNRPCPSRKKTKTKLQWALNVWFIGENESKAEHTKLAAFRKSGRLAVKRFAFQSVSQDCQVSSFPAEFGPINSRIIGTFEYKIVNLFFFFFLYIWMYILDHSPAEIVNHNLAVTSQQRQPNFQGSHGLWRKQKEEKKKTASQHHRSSPAYLPVKIGRFLFTHLECLLEKMFCFGLFLH